MENTICVNMFGSLSVAAGGAVILDGSGKINKPWQVFCYLALNRNAPTAATKLLDVLWADEDLTDPANVLKNTVYALRREFKRAATLQNNPILFENGGYIFNSAINFLIDVEEFQSAYNNAGLSTGEEKRRLLQQAVVHYKGDLLPQLGEAVWVMTQSFLQKKQFTECVCELCSELYDASLYSELLAEATSASKIDPLEEDYYIYIFRALYALQMYRVIIPTYHKISRLFSEEFGTSLNNEIIEIYALSSEKINQIEQDIMIIKDDLRELTFDNRPVNGPLYCTYDVFKYLYRMVARSSERTGARILIILLTIQMQNGEQPPAKLVSSTMGRIKSSILGGLLRKSDTVARYSRTQYIIMLSTEHSNSAKIVTDRIQKVCSSFLESSGIKLVIANTEIDHLHN